MKKFLILGFFLCGICAVSAQEIQPAATNEQESRHERRRREKEEKTEEYCRFIDSMVFAQRFVFRPSSFQAEPAGRINQVNNINFRVDFTGDYIDIYLPYLRGLTPGNRITVLNYTLSYLPDYKAVRSADGKEWEITFTTSLFSPDTFNFKLTIYICTGSAELEIRSQRNSTVSYNGYLTQLY